MHPIRLASSIWLRLHNREDGLAPLNQSPDNASVRWFNLSFPLPIDLLLTRA